MTNILSARLVRTVRLRSAHWQRRALILIGGMTTGAAAVGLALRRDWVQAELHLLVARRRYASLLVTPLNFAQTNYITNSQGSGIPQAIAARELEDQYARSSAGKSCASTRPGLNRARSGSFISCAAPEAYWLPDAIRSISKR